MEDSAKAQASVIAVVPAMLMIMFTVLMVQLRSFSRLFIVLSVGPLRTYRRRRSAATVRKATWIRGHPRNSGIAWHDHQECRDFDRSN